MNRQDKTSLMNRFMSAMPNKPDFTPTEQNQSQQKLFEPVEQMSTTPMPVDNDQLDYDPEFDEFEEDEEPLFSVAPPQGSSSEPPALISTLAEVAATQNASIGASADQALVDAPADVAQLFCREVVLAGCRIANCLPIEMFYKKQGPKTVGRGLRQKHDRKYYALLLPDLTVIDFNQELPRHSDVPGMQAPITVAADKLPPLLATAHTKLASNVVRGPTINSAMAVTKYGELLAPRLYSSVNQWACAVIYENHMHNAADHYCTEGNEIEDMLTLMPDHMRMSKDLVDLGVESTHRYYFERASTKGMSSDQLKFTVADKEIAFTKTRVNLYKHTKPGPFFEVTQVVRQDPAQNPAKVVIKRVVKSEFDQALIGLKDDVGNDFYVRNNKHNGARIVLSAAGARHFPEEPLTASQKKLIAQRKQAAGRARTKKQRKRKDVKKRQEKIDTSTSSTTTTTASSKSRKRKQRSTTTTASKKSDLSGEQSDADDTPFLISTGLNSSSASNRRAKKKRRVAAKVADRRTRDLANGTSMPSGWNNDTLIDTAIRAETQHRDEETGESYHADGFEAGMAAGKKDVMINIARASVDAMPFIPMVGHDSIVPFDKTKGTSALKNYTMDITTTGGWFGPSQIGAEKSIDAANQMDSLRNALTQHQTLPDSPSSSLPRKSFFDIPIKISDDQRDILLEAREDAMQLRLVTPVSTLLRNQQDTVAKFLDQPKRASLSKIRLTAKNFEPDSETWRLLSIGDTSISRHVLKGVQFAFDQLLKDGYAMNGGAGTGTIDARITRLKRLNNPFFKPFKEGLVRDDQNAPQKTNIVGVKSKRTFKAGATLGVYKCSIKPGHGYQLDGESALYSCAGYSMAEAQDSFAVSCLDSDENTVIVSARSFVQPKRSGRSRLLHFMNHSQFPNALLEPHYNFREKGLIVKAITDIAPGDALHIDYGKTYLSKMSDHGIPVALSAELVESEQDESSGDSSTMSTDSSASSTSMTHSSLTDSSLYGSEQGIQTLESLFGIGLPKSPEKYVAPKEDWQNWMDTVDQTTASRQHEKTPAHQPQLLEEKSDDKLELQPCSPMITTDYSHLFKPIDLERAAMEEDMYDADFGGADDVGRLGASIFG